jgi:hypothetical protein
VTLAGPKPRRLSYSVQALQYGFCFIISKVVASSANTSTSMVIRHFLQE